jgi:hypothetical protein
MEANMDTKQALGMAVMVGVVASFGSGVSYGAGDQSGGSDQRPSAFGRTGNQGEGFRDEQTIKGTGRTPESKAGQDAQINVGGARPVVEGQVMRVDGDGYLIRDKSGSEVQVRVNKDTNMECARAGGRGHSVSSGRQADEQTEMAPTAHMQEQQSQHSGSGTPPPKSGDRTGDQSGTQSSSALGQDSGGDIARGSGFNIGQAGGCTFKAGDTVRAEVSDLGTVTSLRYLADGDKGPQQSGHMMQSDSGMTKGEQQSAQQRAQLMKPGSVPAPLDEQHPDMATRDGKQSAKISKDQKDSCEGCQLVRGLVLKSDPDSLLVKDAAQKEVRLKIDPNRLHIGQLSQPRTGTFMEGDRIEAMVMPDGYAWSITALKQQQGQPGVAGAPGD